MSRTDESRRCRREDKPGSGTFFQDDTLGAASKALILSKIAKIRVVIFPTLILAK